MKELFEITKPSPLKLELVDVATSDDPLTQYLERRGYTIKMIESLQASIARKLTVDLFGQVQELTASEIDYQNTVDSYFLTLASERNS